MTRQKTARSYHSEKRSAQHTLDFENFLNGEDEVSRLLDDLRNRVNHHGIGSLSTPERLYFAVDELFCAITNGTVTDLLARADNQILINSAEAFRETGDLAMARNVVQLAELVGEQPLDEFSDEITDAIAPFVTNQLELNERIDAYARIHGLLSNEVS